MSQLLFNDIRKLYGKSFSIDDWTVHIPQTPSDGWPRKGSEGFGLPVKLTHSSKQSIQGFLKVFLIDIPQREKRNAFLVKKGLQKLHGLFHGIPFAIILNEEISGVHITGHIARQLSPLKTDGLDDIDIIKENGKWTFSWDDRKALGESLCVAVSALEKHDIVHGDIAPKNVIVSKDTKGKYQALLCDYDSFYHPSQPLLPIKHENLMVRTLGNPGYQYFELTNTLKKKQIKDDTYVETDRFSLGVLLCEIMTWENGLERKLNPERTHLITEEMILSRDISGIPSKIRNKWKDGFVLLEEAINAPSWRDLPSPEQWLEALGFSVFSLVSTPFAVEPVVEIYKKRGNSPRKKIATAKLSKPKGTFKAIASELEPIQYEMQNKKLTLKLDWTNPIFHTRSSKRINLGNGPKTISISPNDEVLSGYWNFIFK